MDQIKTGKFIATLRKEQGMTQRELADKLNISDKTISRWETGYGMPDENPHTFQHTNTTEKFDISDYTNSHQSTINRKKASNKNKYAKKS